MSQNVPQGPKVDEVKKYKIGIVCAKWNSAITDKLLNGAIEKASFYGIEVEVMSVPGSFELPLGAQCLAQKIEIDAVVCLGCVIRGDTSHYDHVCQSAAEGIMRVGLDTGKPVIFGLITVEHKKQAYERAGGKHGNKGAEGVEAALAMLQAMKK